MQDSSKRLALRKRELRAETAASRDGLLPEQRERLSALVCSHAWSWITAEKVRSLLAYAPFRSELDCRPLLMHAWAENCEVLLPRVNREAGTLGIHPVRSWDELVPGAYGIPEPAAGGAVPAADSGLPEAVFVPGLAFDRRGGRLGYGQGYYDRLRAAGTAGAQETVRPLWIGLAYNLQVVPEVPLEEHDALIDMLITENGIWNCREEKMLWS
ncbi:5-formyltetrahydrofolate cyclo-ligase [Paenibacillus sp. MMS20-IR301]|uniref:5-formyltetrahydrofolate cyclo-ligase n=1 Tax=Paenibacillus sp. MMS20-IR301 TaxID=2895946 RepID=UPI0028EAAC43|nr:5-formyltetrahydrofolate cyclo-ligase [Paenibacillus sp. MMS20-IR301]WNS41224.1 5-formyltetrahydrofolate cyclo-ligase [Paenibacillus sp. MMS20-IR301]